MDFEYDVFISYRHLDNKPLSKGQEGWISTFHDMLKTCLGQELGYNPKIWIDEKKLKGLIRQADFIFHQLPLTLHIIAKNKQLTFSK